MARCLTENLPQNSETFAEAKEKPPEVQSTEEKKTPKAQRLATSEPLDESSRQVVDVGDGNWNAEMEHGSSSHPVWFFTKLNLSRLKIGAGNSPPKTLFGPYYTRRRFDIFAPIQVTAEEILEYPPLSLS